jgi:hypothetical protein
LPTVTTASALATGSVVTLPISVEIFGLYIIMELSGQKEQLHNN